MKKWKALPWEIKVLAAVTTLSLLVISAASLWNSSSPSESLSSAAMPGIDTYIPKGYVLVPIEVQNYEALDSILGKFGLVDLFRTKDEGGKVIARNVRLLRAPQNPSRFAVLVEEALADRVLEYQGNIFVVVKPKSNAGTEFEKRHTKRRIVFEGEES